MNQEIPRIFEVDAMKDVVGIRLDPEVAALPKRRQFSAAYKRRFVREVSTLPSAGRGRCVIAPVRVVQRSPHALAPGGRGQQTRRARA